MKLSRLFILLCLIVLTISCSSVTVDHVSDPDADFGAMKSYDWLPVPSTSIRYPLILKQIKSEMDRQMKVRNFMLVDREPDFFITVHGGIQSMLAYKDWEYLQENYREYAIKRRLDMTTYVEDTLIFDFIDAGSKELIYRATATIYLGLETTSEKREKKIREAVTKVLDHYRLTVAG
jgi:hypothetical protein